MCPLRRSKAGVYSGSESSGQHYVDSSSGEIQANLPVVVLAKEIGNDRIPCWIRSSTFEHPNRWRGPEENHPGKVATSGWGGDSSRHFSPERSRISSEPRSARSMAQCRLDEEATKEVQLG